MKHFLTALLICFATFLSAQIPKEKMVADTVQAGYYLPFSPNTVSCKVHIVTINGASKIPAFDTTLTGNRLPQQLIHKIATLPAGSTVVYYEITESENSVLKKMPAMHYMIGTRNTKPALRDPSLPEPISATDLAAMHFDADYISFVMAFKPGESYVEIAQTGNEFSEKAKTMISSFQPGQKVFIEQVTRNKNGTPVKSPGRVFVIQ
jgi:hypothetical protein